MSAAVPFAGDAGVTKTDKAFRKSSQLLVSVVIHNREKGLQERSDSPKVLQQSPSRQLKNYRTSKPSKAGREWRGEGPAKVMAVSWEAGIHLSRYGDEAQNPAPGRLSKRL